MKELLLKNKVKEYRTNKELSQNALARKVGVSRNTICSIELGKCCPTALLAATLCLALECSFEELFYFD